ncbi:MAG TPA: ATP phosphoribosyltransferase regulatory subunit [Pyrinomonadaceae bacterium]|nr:ATP phosphoribosyltransferase regulatory subunit [Pyrinomonadaceae bacterium]
MSEPLSKIPSGMRYYTGAEARLRRSVEDTVMSVFDGWSYEEITTPCVDYLALFERGMGYEQAHRAFRFTDSDGRLLALRPDVTSSVARAAATLFAGRARPLRFCYASPVFRQRPASHAEWRRENKQLGCELFGALGHGAEVEALSVASEILAALDLADDYRITVNSVEIFNGIAAHLALDERERESMRELIDRRDAAELQKFLARFRTNETERASFSRLVRLSGKGDILAEARDIITNPRSVAALNELESLWRIIGALDLADRCDIDLGDVSGLDYYTGLTFKIYVRGAGTRVGGGGRYDNLTANFGRAEPAVGFVLDLDALTDVLMRRTQDAASRETSDAETSRLAGSDSASLFTDARRCRVRRERVLVDFKE